MTRPDKHAARFGDRYHLVMKLPFHQWQPEVLDQWAQAMLEALAARGKRRRRP